MTFFSKAQDFDTTILVVRDEYNYVFGAFCVEPWEYKCRFFGTGENFLFSFKDGEELSVYYWTGDGDRHQYSDRDAIGLAGSS